MDRFDPRSALAPSLQRYQQYSRQRQLTLGDLLLENRIIFLEGVIDDGSANLIVMKMLYLQYENRKQEIHFYINSPGGSVSSTLAIYDTMQFVACDVATYCIGQCASMGAVLLTAGAKNKRFCLPNARVMIHQPLAGSEGTATDLEIHALEFRRLKRRLNDILLKHSGRTLEEIDRDTDRDKFMPAEDAVSYGLVDRILTEMEPGLGGTIKTNQD